MSPPDNQPAEILLRDWQDFLQKKILHANAEMGNTFSLSTVHLNTGNCSPQIRFQIYSNAYVLRLTEALRCNYPAIHKLLGDNEFDVMAKHYLDSYPPAHASIRWFGEYLSVFLAEENPYAQQPVFAELAQFEWALRHTIDAADAQRLSVEELQAVNPADWPELRFGLHPSLSIMNLQWNAVQIWQAITQEKTPPTPRPLIGQWLVYRQPDLVSAWRSASDAEIASLAVIRSGKTFADLCEHLIMWTDEVEKIPQIAAGFLRGWIEQGLLIDA